MTNYNDFYVYAHLREDLTPQYIGKGRGKRALSEKRTIPKPKDPSRIVLLHEDLDEETAFDLEVSLIYHYGRKDIGTGILWNFTDGGEGSSGLVHSEEAKKKMSIVHKGKIISEEQKKKISDSLKGQIPWNKGKPHSEETKKKISDNSAQKGQIPWNKGKPHSEEQKKKISFAMKGEKNHNFGKNLSEEQKKKISDAKKLYYLSKKSINTSSNLF